MSKGPFVSIKHGLLALLVREPLYGARLRTEFEQQTGGTWPLNIGQVYTTLARLERDRLVEHLDEPDEEGRHPYRLTSAGQQTVEAWWRTPVEREPAPRSELAIKLALAVTVPGVDVTAVVQTQRAATLSQLQDLTRLKRQRSDSEELAWSLVLEHLIFAAEAEIRWLDHIEATLHRHRPASGTGSRRTAEPAEPAELEGAR
jgi:DNA-binding PadR family transcriptional regulator